MYPHGSDYVWLGANRRGEVGAFAIAGLGPIPADVLARCDIAGIEPEVLRLLPVSSGATLLIELPKPDSFLALATRGLFVYDWRDLHRVRAEYTDAYELMAVPDQPLSFDALPEPLRGWTAQLPAESFGAALPVEGLRPGPY